MSPPGEHVNSGLSLAHQAKIISSEGLFGGLQEMRRIAVAVVLMLLSIECHAQSGPSAGQCDQVRAAIAQHGLQNTRKHAMANYGLTLVDLRNIEQTCGIGERDRGGRRPKRANWP
jgi:hypothetical protein